ncbi:DUF4864 domain-containing protein [Longibacter salinarum]|nr:DUF4864 domain-containing protein [Longibacter salinarum]
MPSVAPDSLPGPSPSLTPVEVVQTQVEALKQNNAPFEGAGVETAYRFASPKSRAETGQLTQFRALFASAPYGPMLDHITAEYSEPQVTGDIARVGVIVITETGDRVSYLFQLERQSYPPYEDCWMTDAVVPVKKEDRTSVGT